jgi:hypothetical protein
MSAIPHIADSTRTSRHFRVGPISEIRQCERKANYFVRIGFAAGMGAGVGGPSNAYETPNSTAFVAAFLLRVG